MRILLADDHILFREMLREMLPFKGQDYTVIGEANNGAEILELVTTHQPDLLLLDYKMPGLGRLSTFCKEVRRRSPTTHILILSGYAEEEIALQAAAGGAHGYILKGAPFADLLDALTTVYAGGIWLDPRLSPQEFHAFLHRKTRKKENLEKLSRRELIILSLVAQGMNNREIGDHLRISRKTVKNHLSHIFSKLGVADRQQAASYFVGGKNANLAHQNSLGGHSGR